MLGIAGYSAISIYRHDHFGSAAFDLGVYDQLIWGYSRFSIIYNSVSQIPNLLGDHFHPILMLLAPIYWIWDDVRALLIVQAVLLAFASVPIFWWVRDRLGLAPALLFQAAYLVFWGILAGDLFDFHQLSVAVPAVSLALYAAMTRNNLLLWPSAAVALLSKEDVSLTFLFLGLFLLVAQRRWRTGLSLAAISTGYFWLVLKVVIPWIRGGTAYGHWTYTSLGPTPEAAIAHLLQQPWDAISDAIEPFKKVELVGALLTTWLFLPLLSPLLIVAIPLIAERVWSDSPEFWSTQYQYSMVIAPVLAFAAADTLNRVAQRWPQINLLFRSLTSAALLVAGLILSFIVIQPLDELSHEITSAQAAQVQHCLNTIPPDASVAASSYLVPHLSHRKEIDTLPVGIGQTVYLAVGPLHSPQYPSYDSYLASAASGGYRVTCSSGLATVLER